MIALSSRRSIVLKVSDWRDPGSPLYYDGLNKMPPLGQKLAAAEIDDLVAFLQTLAQPQVTLNP